MSPRPGVADWSLSEHHLEALNIAAHAWEAMGFSKVTVQGYRTRVKWFLGFLEARRMKLRTCGMIAVESFIRGRSGTSSFNTQVAVNVALNRFLNVADARTLIDWKPEPIERAGSGQVVDRDEIPDEAQIRELMRHVEATATTPIRKRLCLFLHLAFTTQGMRSSEVVSLRMAQLHLDKDSKIELTKVRRKKGHQQTIPLPDQAAAAMRAWLKFRAKPKGPLSPKSKPLPKYWGASPYVFPGGKRGKHLTYAQFYREVVKVGLEVGLAITPHMLRHCFGTFALSAGANITDLRDAMGHRHITSLNSYLHSRKEGRRRVGQQMADAVLGEDDKDPHREHPRAAPQLHSKSTKPYPRPLADAQSAPKARRLSL